MVTIVTDKWKNVCSTLLFSDKEKYTFVDERRALQIIERNVYHKKPSQSLVSFVFVSS